MALTFLNVRSCQMPQTRCHVYIGPLSALRIDGHKNHLVAQKKLQPSSRYGCLLWIREE